MQINVRKCCALAVSSRPKSRVYDPKLRIGSETVPFVGCSVFKFLGLPFDMSLSPCVVQNKLVKHIDFARKLMLYVSEDGRKLTLCTV